MLTASADVVYPAGGDFWTFTFSLKQTFTNRLFNQMPIYIHFFNLYFCTSWIIYPPFPTKINQRTSSFRVSNLSQESKKYDFFDVASFSRTRDTGCKK